MESIGLILGNSHSGVAWEKTRPAAAWLYFRHLEAMPWL